MMTYFNRPKLVRNALNSILKNNETHQNWYLIFGDDNSKIPGEPIVREILADHVDKIRFIRSNATIEEKIEKGMNLGAYANMLLKNSDADYAITLCDDDELHPVYLANLNKFFNDNPSVWHCYSDVQIYNPLMQQASEVTIDLNSRYNKHREPINAAGKLDASQVAWRLYCNKVKDAWYDETTIGEPGQPWANNLDQNYFNSLFEKCGPCIYTGFVSQYKGIHDYQLLWHKDTDGAGLKKYNELVERHGGDKF